MMRKLIILGIWIGASGPLWAGAWPQGAGEFYGKAGFSLSQGDRIFSPKGKKLEGPDFKERALFVYGEYGLSSRWTAGASFPYKILTARRSGASVRESGLSDLWMFARRSFKERPWALSGQAGVKIPLGYGRSQALPLGEGQIDWEARLLAGKSFHPFYAQAEAGFRLRNGPLSDEIAYRWELGWRPGKRVLLKWSLEGTENLTNDRASDLNDTDPRTFDKEYAKTGPAALYFFGKGFSGEVSYEKTVNGGNSSILDGFSLGLAWRGHW